MKKALLLGLTLVAMIACQTITGTLTVKKSFAVSTDKGAVTLSSGTYDVRLKFEGSKVNVTDGQGINFKMKLPTSLTRSGKFPAGKSVTAQELGQAFGMSFFENRTLVDVQQRTENVTCTLNEWDRQCHGRQHGRVCDNNPWGTARALVEVSSYDVARAIKFQQGQSTLANFASLERATERRVLRQGPCRPDRAFGYDGWDSDFGF